MADLAELLEDPVIATGVARALVRDLGRRNVARALMRDLTEQAKQNGSPLPIWAESLLRALVHDADSFASETPDATVAREDVHGFVSVAVAAEAGEVSKQYVRELARLGDIRARRPGRDWQIDLDSLLRVLRRTG